jgi:hypothetical protein
VTARAGGGGKDDNKAASTAGSTAAADAPAPAGATVVRSAYTAEEPSREELAAALAANAAAKPFNIAVALFAFGAALVAGAPLPIALLAALVVYSAAAARTMFDGDEAERVAQRRRAGRKAPPVAQRLAEARTVEARIRDAVERAELPFAEVSDELDGLMALIEQSARHAQPDRFHGELERVTVELDAVRAALVSLCASTDTAQQQRLAAAVRTLRDELVTACEQPAGAPAP